MPLTETNPDIKVPGYIDNNNVYDLKHTGISDETSNVHTEPVIFEPIRNIKNDFAPNLINFIKFNKYLQACKRDLKNEKKMGTLMEVDPNYLIDGKEWDCTQDMKDGYGTLKCRFYRQYLRILKNNFYHRRIISIHTPKDFGCHRSFR